MTARADIDERIVILAPSAHDAPVAAHVLAQAGFTCALARDLPELRRLLDEGAAAALVAEEALVPATTHLLTDFVRQQEPWSDLPLILLTDDAGVHRRPLPTTEALAPFGNVTLLPRPFQVITLVSAVAAALRARRRQYD